MTSPMDVLNQLHFARLQASAIPGWAIDNLTERGMLSSDARGLRFNYDKDFYRIRMDNPKPGKGKYIQPQNSPVRAFVLPDRESKPCRTLIVEGELKAISAWARLANYYRVIGLGGCWNWIAKGSDKKQVIDDIDKRADGVVYICFDSDATENTQVLRAEMMLASALRAKHDVRVIELPVAHKGLDDWFLAWGENWHGPLRDLFGKAVQSRAAYHFKGIYDQVYSYQEMLETRFPIPRFFWGSAETAGYVGEGLVTFLHGRTNIGKTYFLLQLACAVSGGYSFLEIPCTAGKVLLLQGELAAGLYAGGRLRPVAEKLGFIPDNLIFHNWAFPLAVADRFGKAFEGQSWSGFEKLERMIDEYAPNVVAIDPLQVYNNLAESSIDQNRELMKRFKAIATERHVAFIITDHIRKPTGVESDTIFNMRGAGCKADIADTVISLQWNVEDKQYHLNWDKVRYTNSARPDPLPLRRDGPFFVIDKMIKREIE